MKSSFKITIENSPLMKPKINKNEKNVSPINLIKKYNKEEVDLLNYISDEERKIKINFVDEDDDDKSVETNFDTNNNFLNSDNNLVNSGNNFNNNFNDSFNNNSTNSNFFKNSKKSLRRLNSVDYEEDYKFVEKSFKENDLTFKRKNIQKTQLNWKLASEYNLSIIDFMSLTTGNLEIVEEPTKNVEIDKDLSTAN